MKTTTVFIFMTIFIYGGIAPASDLSGSLSEEFQSFYQATAEQSQWLSKTSLTTKGEFSLTKKSFFKTDGAIYYSKADRDKKNYVEASGEKFGLLYTGRFFDLFAGAFTLTPEGPDLNNLFDVVNSKDFKQPFQSKSLGNAGLHLNTFLDSFSLQLFYFPQQSKSKLPSLESVWWPRSEALPLYNSTGTFYLPASMSYQLKSEIEYDDPFQSAHGAHLKYTYNDFDFYGFYFKGANQVPSIYPEFNINLTSLDPLVGEIVAPIDLNLTWYASEHLGAGFNYVLGGWILKAFYKQQVDRLAIEKKSTSSTVTVENSFSLGRYTVRYFLQSNRTWKAETASELQTLLGFFDKSSALGFYLDGDSWGQVSGAVIYNEDKGGVLSSLNYDYRWSDHFKSKLTLNTLTPSNDLVGQSYDKTDNAVLSLSYDFGLL